MLDFGLAKAYEPEPANTALSNSPTMMSMGATNAGMILGTAAYMSPEQARGRAVDRRTDIFAFGCVFYEMLTGKGAFNGEDIAEILSRVLQREPDWTLLPNGLPPGIEKVLQLCLEKDVRKRRTSARDVRLDIEHALKRLESAPVTVSAVPTMKTNYAIPWLAAAVFAIAASIARMDEFPRAAIRHGRCDVRSLARDCRRTEFRLRVSGWAMAGLL